MTEFLTGRSALITGSVQGIGQAIARSLAGSGVKIAVHGLAHPDEAAGVMQEMRDTGAPDVRFFDADLKDIEQIDKMMDALEDWTGGVDILVNNAGIQLTGALDELTPQTWTDIIDVNLSAAFHTMRRAMPGMAERQYGRVINVASVHGLVASVQKAPYVASKFGLVGLSRVAALEYADKGSRDSGGITVNCICPGWTETAIIEPQVAARADVLGATREEAIHDLLKEKQPSRRTSLPEEMGEFTAWLCSRMAHNITGTAIPVDGGWTAQ
ncbi:MAG: 3-hydroxybutyrate dehydrogenase [Fimbriimonadaceae bacterium]|nr:3-hydroxybutyrate dehydrogenase [Alphaproteobacteria bacterium]